MPFSFMENKDTTVLTVFVVLLVLRLIKEIKEVAIILLKGNMIKGKLLSCKIPAQKEHTDSPRF